MPLIDEEIKKYSFTKAMVAFQAFLFPFILYGFIFGIGSINVHYNIFNISSIKIINNTVINNNPDDDLWKIGFDINISVGVILLYFIIYLCFDLLIAFCFIIEGGLLWYVSNIMRFYMYTNNLCIFMIVISVLFLIIYIMTYWIPKYENKDLRFFPGVIVMAPFFTIFNTLNALCKYNGVCKNTYSYDGYYFGHFGALLPN